MYEKAEIRLKAAKVNEVFGQDTGEEGDGKAGNRSIELTTRTHNKPYTDFSDVLLPRKT